MDGPLGALLQRAAREHRRQLATLLAPHGLYPGQDALLLLVWDGPGMRQSELADALAVEPATVTRMLQRLERGGMIERRPDVHDGRATRIHPTPRSRLIEATVRRVWAQVEEEMRQALGANDDVLVQRLLSDLASTWEPS